MPDIPKSIFLMPLWTTLETNKHLWQVEGNERILQEDIPVKSCDRDKHHIVTTKWSSLMAPASLQSPVLRLSLCLTRSWYVNRATIFLQSQTSLRQSKNLGQAKSSLRKCAQLFLQYIKQPKASRSVRALLWFWVWSQTQWSVPSWQKTSQNLKIFFSKKK